MKIEKRPENELENYRNSEQTMVMSSGGVGSPPPSNPYSNDKNLIPDFAYADDGLIKVYEDDKGRYYLDIETLQRLELISYEEYKALSSGKIINNYGRGFIEIYPSSLERLQRIFRDKIIIIPLSLVKEDLRINEKRPEPINFKAADMNFIDNDNNYNKKIKEEMPINDISGYGDPEDYKKR